MKKKINISILLFIFIFAFLLRFWQLGNNPPSLDWDEASLGYNAYSILKTGADEYGNFLPLAIRSFNDYKPPLYTYLTIIPIAVFGLNEFSTRFISAFFGTLSVIVSYFLAKELFSSESSDYLPGVRNKFFLLFTFLFAMSPWHIQFSRIAFEANLALFFFVTGSWFFLIGQRQRLFYIPSLLSFALTIYSYHSPRLVVPIFLTGAFFIFRKTVWQKKKTLFIALLLFFLFLTPLVNLTKSTVARFGSVTLLNPNELLGSSIKDASLDLERNDRLGMLLHNRRIIYARNILAGYLDHFNFNFLFLNGDFAARHHASSMGMLYIWDFVFVAIGVFYLIKYRTQKIYFLFWWFVSAPIASALTKATPHAVRSLLYLPTYQIFIAFGLLHFKDYINSKFDTRNTKIIVISIFLLLIANFYYYMHMYWIHTPVEESKSWQYGYKEVVAEVSRLENNFDKIIVTYEYDQPYIYFLFYNKIGPLWYQKNWGSGEIERAHRAFGKYEFRTINWEEDSKQPNTLLVGSPKEIPPGASGIVKEIYFLEGSPAFRIVAK